MLRVMMLSTDLQRGGLPMRFAALAKWLQERDIEPIVGCLAEAGPLSAELESAGIRTFACEAAGRFDVGCLPRLARWIRQFDPDVIHSALFHANVAARCVGRLDRHRPIISSTVTIEIERRWHRWLEALTSDRSDVHVANSACVAEHLVCDVGFRPDRVVVIPNAIDPNAAGQAAEVDSASHGIEDGIPLIVWAGRMDPVKDLPTFLDVVERLSVRGPMAAVLIGDGPERERLQHHISTHGLSRIIRMIGWSHNVIGWMKRADVLLFPSRTEGSPNVVIEAMAAGCAVVASDIPACRDLIEDGATGRLCPVGDSASFAAAVRGLLADSIARREMIEAARRRVLDRHAAPRVVGRWHALYHRLCGVSSHHSE